MSEWKEGAARRRDLRNMKTPDEHRTTSRKKDTHRWCKGRSGVEHQPKCLALPKPVVPAFAAWRELVCTNCSKRLAWWGGRGEKPAWVDS